MERESVQTSTGSHVARVVAVKKERVTSYPAEQSRWTRNSYQALYPYVSLTSVDMFKEVFR